MTSYIDKTTGRTSTSTGAIAASTCMPPTRTSGRHNGGDSGHELGEATIHSGVHGADLGPLADMIGFALRRAQLAVFEDAIRSFAELDLRPAQVSVLALVGHRPGSKQSELAATLRIQRANFVALLDRLEQRGLAQRRSAPNDRRCHAVFLTEEGERVLARAGTMIVAIEARLDAKLGPGGREQLLDMLWRLAAD